MFTTLGNRMRIFRVLMPLIFHAHLQSAILFHPQICETGEEIYTSSQMSFLVSAEYIMSGGIFRACVEIKP